jgi:hypothetical protein
MASRGRAYTTEEVRERFLRYIWETVEYWEEYGTDTREKLEGLAFSILATLDGSTLAFPPFIVAPFPHPDDKQCHRDAGERWFPETRAVPTDIAGSLHELFFLLRPRR